MENRLHHKVLILVAITLLVCCNNKHQANKNEQTARFIADSGYILKKEGISFLLQLTNSRTVDTIAPDFKESDTIGKYYKTKTGNYIACLLDIIHLHEERGRLLIEFKPNGEIIKIESTYDASYTDCFNNSYGDFEKHGDYYSLKICGNGSGYYPGDITLFKEVAPQTNTIPATVWSNICIFQENGKPPLACNLTSKISIVNDTVTMRYKLEHLKPDDTNDIEYKLVDTELFDIKYFKKETRWVALDSSNFSKIPQ